MGLIATLLSFTRNGNNISEAKADPGGGNNLSFDHYQDAGSDAHPLPGDFIVTVRDSRSGAQVAVGYIDTQNQGVAALGEKRLYARDANGAVVCSLRLANNGIIHAGEDEADDFLGKAALILARLEHVTNTYNSHTHSETGSTTLAPTQQMDAPASVATTKFKAT